MLHVRVADGSVMPRNYTVEPGKQLIGVWPVKTAGKSSYDLTVHGPNGFYRAFKGSVAVANAALLDARTSRAGQHEGLTLALRNLAARTAHVSILDKYNGERAKLKLERRESRDLHWPLARTEGWYDLVITVEGDANFEYALAGRIEDGRDSISDPAMADVSTRDWRRIALITGTS